MVKFARTSFSDIRENFILYILMVLTNIRGVNYIDNTRPKSFPEWPQCCNFNESTGRNK